MTDTPTLVTVKDVYGRKVRVDANTLLNINQPMLRMYNQYGHKLEYKGNRALCIHRGNIPLTEVERAREKVNA